MEGNRRAMAAIMTMRNSFTWFGAAATVCTTT